MNSAKSGNYGGVRAGVLGRAFAGLAAAFLMTLPLLVSAQGDDGWSPTRPVTMVVPFSPGGGSDIFGRAMASGLEEIVPDLTMKVENRTGGSGAVGYSYLLAQQGDPHFLLPSETTGVALPLSTDVQFHWTDFTPIAQVAEDAVMLVVRDDAPYEAPTDFVDAAKEESLAVGVASATGVDSVNVELLESDQGIELQTIVFNSGGEIVVALLAGDIDAGMLNPGEVLGQIEAGDLRAVTVFAENRYQDGLLSDVPTSLESGIDVSFTQYRGPFAAGNITDEQRAFWEDAFREYVESDQYRKYVSDNMLIATQRFGQEFEDYLERYEETLEGMTASE